MCFTLYLGTEKPISGWAGTRLTLSLGSEDPIPEMPCLAGLTVSYVAVDGGCSCGIPIVSAEHLIDYFPGMFSAKETRANAPLAEELLRLLKTAAEQSSVVKMFPVWEDDGVPTPKGGAELSISDCSPEELVLTERFLYSVTA